MKFSFSLIKKLAPGKYNKTMLVEKLNAHSFEAVDVGGDMLEIAVPPNRFSDAASHIGIAREAAAIFNLQLNDPSLEKIKFDSKESGVFRVNIKNKNLGKRYLAAYAADMKVGPSPQWIKDALESCGLRPINNVVDITNYVMLEIGQPMHAFDAEKVSAGIVVRNAQKNEAIETIDGQKFSLDNNMLVIADAKKALAIAGIKGGKSCEIGFKTKEILMESANFDGVSIYNASKKLGLQTDASIRFSHNLSPELAEIGMRRALSLLKEITGAKIYAPMDIYPKRQSEKALVFDIEKINGIIGEKISKKEALNILLKLGFRKKGKYLAVPLLRPDIEDIEDVAEEIARIKGYDRLIPSAPKISLGFASEEEQFLIKDKIRNLLIGSGFSEMYNYSFISKNEISVAPVAVFGNEKAVALANPISKQSAFLRDSLAPGLIKNLNDNLRFFDEVRIFEIGRIFGNAGKGVKETQTLGISVCSKNAILELKGLIDMLFQKLGIIDYFLPDLALENKILKAGESLRIEDGNHRVLGYIGSIQGMRGALLEINLDKLATSLVEEKEYEPLSKFPSIIRDISILVNNEIRVGEILAIIQKVSPKWTQDVDLIDWYQDEKLGDNKKSLTFRIVFQADDKTLTDAEIDREMAVINQVLIDKFNVELR